MGIDAQKLTDKALQPFSVAYRELFSLCVFFFKNEAALIGELNGQHCFVSGWVGVKYS